MKNDIMNVPSIEDAIELVQRVHNKPDWAGIPYWHHTVTVMNLLPVVRPGHPVSHLLKLKALLHDALEDFEDTGLTRAMLLDLGYPEEVVASAERLSRPKGVDYLLYIEGLEDEDDLWVKLADNHTNTSRDGFDLLSPEKQKTSRRLTEKRYIPAKAILRRKLGLEPV